MSVSSILQSKPAPSVRASLAALVIACVLPVAAIAAFLIVNFYDKERAQLINNTVSRAHAAIAEVDRDIGATQLALQTLATSRSLAAGDLAQFHARAVDALATLPGDSIFVLDTSGKMLLSTHYPYAAPLPRLAQVPLLRQIVASGGPGVSDLFVGPLSGHYIYAIGVPIVRNGAVAMTLNASATPTHLTQILAEQKLPPSWRASIVDSHYQVVARSHEIDKYAGRQLNAELRRRLGVASELGFETRSLDGLDVFVVFSRSAVSGWTAIFGIPLAELTAGLRATLAWLIAATAAALVAGLALAWLIGGRIAHSVQALIGPALALAGGHQVTLPRLHFREARELGQALCSAAEGLRESQQRLELAADAAHLGLWIRDLQRREIWLSDQWRALFGFAAEQTVQLSDLLARVHPDDRAAVQRTLELAEQGVPSYDMEYRIVLPDGAQRWIGSHGSVTLDAGGRPALVRGVSLDITARKSAELDLQQKQKEVTHLSRVAVLGELSGALAHELNQPLTAILSNAQAALRFMDREPADLAEVREILHDIVGEDQRAGEIIRRLRRLFDKHETPRQRCDVDALVRDVVHLLRNDLINHGVTVVIEPCEGAAVIADRVQLQQVLINLLMNACDAMAATRGGAIVVRTAMVATVPAAVAAVQNAGAVGDAALLRSGQAADAVELSVTDHGGGIAPADLERIFDPFYTTKEHGMGLGLSICRNIAGAHGGRLWAVNHADGARLCLRLPLAGAEPA